MIVICNDWLIWGVYKLVVFCVYIVFFKFCNNFFNELLNFIIVCVFFVKIGCDVGINFLIVIVFIF